MWREMRQIRKICFKGENKNIKVIHCLLTTLLSAEAKHYFLLWSVAKSPFVNLYQTCLLILQCSCWLFKHFQNSPLYNLRGGVAGLRRGCQVHSFLRSLGSGGRWTPGALRKGNQPSPILGPRLRSPLGSRIWANHRLGLLKVSSNEAIHTVIYNACVLRHLQTVVKALRFIAEFLRADTSGIWKNQWKKFNKAVKLTDDYNEKKMYWNSKS